METPVKTPVTHTLVFVSTGNSTGVNIHLEFTVLYNAMVKIIYAYENRIKNNGANVVIRENIDLGAWFSEKWLQENNISSNSNGVFSIGDARLIWNKIVSNEKKTFAITE